MNMINFNFLNYVRAAHESGIRAAEINNIRGHIYRHAAGDPGLVQNPKSDQPAI
jgi:hypothetical protein